MSRNPTPLKAQYFPLFNVNLSQLQLNSISTKLPFNLISTSFHSQVQINLSFNINLNSTSTITSTQYDCDIKATQSCSTIILITKLSNIHLVNINQPHRNHHWILIIWSIGIVWYYWEHTVIILCYWNCINIMTIWACGYRQIGRTT